ncbi:MAG: SIMPL domain-containing protein [Bacteroidetes bacterium]|nr:SIMPL domain-containing protein [Bacteroidota bacterium]
MEKRRSGHYLIQEAVGGEYKRGFVLRVEHSKIDSLRKEVRITAIKAAKDKAEYLLAAVGEQIDKALEIREEAEPMYRSFLANNVQVSDPGDLAKSTEFKTMTIKFSYYIKYAIR